jgi:hypothetical protein
MRYSINSENLLLVVVLVACVGGFLAGLALLVYHYYNPGVLR